MGLAVIRHKKFVTTRRLQEVELQTAHQDLAQRYRSNQAAFSFHRNSSPFDCVGGDSRINPVAFMDPEPGIAAQVQDRDIVLSALPQRTGKHPAELLCAPGAVHAAEGASLQCNL